jgi:hypothetical protein
MSAAAEMAQDLRSHLVLCQELLRLVERESLHLRGPSPAWAELDRVRKNLLPRLDQSLARLKQHRLHWQQLDAPQRRLNPEISALLRVNQDVIMKVLMLDRENEQGRLRLGRVPPGRLPSAHAQRPHFVSELYRRYTAR